MESLNSLKKIWNINNDSEYQINFDKLLKKTSKFERKIHLTCLFEMIFWLTISTLIGYNNKDYVNHMNNDGILKILDYSYYIVFLFFVYRFYSLNKRIDFTNNTYKLLINLLEIRKNLFYFIYFNLCYIAFTSVLTLIYFINYSNDFSLYINNETNNIFFKYFIFILVYLIAITTIIFIFKKIYFLVYGHHINELKRKINILKKSF